MSILGFILALFGCALSGVGGALGMRWSMERKREVADHEDPRDTQIRELQTALKVARNDAARMREASAEHQESLAQANARIEDLEQQVSQAGRQYATCKTILMREISQKNGLRDELEQARKALVQAEERAQELELELSILQGADMLEAGTSERPVAGTGVEAEEDEDAEASGEFAPPLVTDSSPSLIRSLSGELERWKKHCHVLGEELKTAREQVGNGADGNDGDASPLAITDVLPTDELTAIRGIGSVLERKLHQLGIYRYQELTRLTPEHLKEISILIPDFKARMRRFNWVEQARQLHEDKYQEAV